MQEAENNIKNTSAESEVLEKIAAFSDKYRPIAERLHTVIMSAGHLYPRKWYGMPGYAKSKDGPVLVFFREDTYISFGLSESAHFSELQSKSAKLVSSAWFLTHLDEATEKEIVCIVQEAIK
jgi:hypothetical protein